MTQRLGHLGIERLEVWSFKKFIMYYETVVYVTRASLDENRSVRIYAGIGYSHIMSAIVKCKTLPPNPS